MERVPSGKHGPDQERKPAEHYGRDGAGPPDPVSPDEKRRRLGEFTVRKAMQDQRVAPPEERKPLREQPAGKPRER